MNVLGTYSKALPSSASINFAPNCGANCSARCLAKRMGVCYGIQVEKQRPIIRTSLENRLTAGCAAVANAAADNVHSRYQRNRPIPWARISVFGSVPNAPTRADIGGLRNLISTFQQYQIPYHFPVETMAKSRLYRRKLPDVLVRESCESVESFLMCDRPCSVIVGQRGLPRRPLVDVGKSVAKAHTAMTGRPCKLCPMIASRFLSPAGKPAPLAKCGRCILCSLDYVDVIYLLH